VNEGRPLAKECISKASSLNTAPFSPPLVGYSFRHIYQE
jgi:hypothetical protein